MPAAGDEIVASDITDVEDLTTGRPLVRLVQAVVQSMADNTFTAITYTTEVIDTHNFHDTGSNTARITPTIAGYYRFYATYVSATMTTPVLLAVKLRLNGSTDLAPGGRASGANSNPSIACVAEQSMNGTTDYMEMMGLQDSSGAVNTIVSGHSTSAFACEYLRPA